MGEKFRGKSGMENDMEREADFGTLSDQNEPAEVRLRNVEKRIAKLEKLGPKKTEEEALELLRLRERANLLHDAINGQN